MLFRKIWVGGVCDLIEPGAGIVLVQLEQSVHHIPVSYTHLRRGQIQGMEAMAGTQRVNAFVPLAQMFGYATDLRSKTQGRGQYVMELSLIHI